MDTVENLQGVKRSLEVIGADLDALLLEREEALELLTEARHTQHEQAMNIDRLSQELSAAKQLIEGLRSDRSVLIDRVDEQLRDNVAHAHGESPRTCVLCAHEQHTGALCQNPRCSCDDHAYVGD